MGLNHRLLHLCFAITGMSVIYQYLSDACQIASTYGGAIASTLTLSMQMIADTACDAQSEAENCVCGPEQKDTAFQVISRQCC